MKILTAIGKSELNDSLREEESVEVVGKDILYQEGILEILETREDIDIVAVSNLLPEEMNFLFLIDKIKKINESIDIVVFLEKEDVNIENFLNSKKIYKIYYLDENGIEVFMNSLRNRNTISFGIHKEIEDLREMILSTRDGQEYNEEDECKRSQHLLESNVISITGNAGSGKSVISCILAKQLEKMKKKVALVDFDCFCGSIQTILGLKDNSYKETTVSKYLTVFTDTNSIIENPDDSNTYNINQFIMQLKQEYEYIILDMSSNVKYKYMNTILNYSNKIIFLLEPDLIGISKAKDLLEILVKDQKINVDKIRIVFNKSNRYQIAEDVLEEIFQEFEHIGNIHYDEKYSLFINKNLTIFDIENVFEKIYEN